MNTQDRIRELDNRVAALEAKKAERAQILKDLERETKLLTEESDLLTKTEQTLLHISTRLLGQSTKTIDKLVSAGLRLVFDDQNLEFRTLTDKSRGKTAIKFQLLDDGRATPIMDSYGGGVLVTAGVLLRVVTITTLGMKRVLFLDETLSHLSENYVDNASRLLRKLCDELDFDIIMVTHQPEFAAHANVRYKADRKAGTTVLTKE